jgi:hypothetical protein
VVTVSATPTAVAAHASAEPVPVQAEHSADGRPTACADEEQARLVPLAAEGSLELDLRRLFAAAPSAEAATIAIETHVRELRGEGVVTRAVQRLGLDHDAAYARDEAEAVDRLARTLRARRRGSSAVIEVGIEDVRIDPKTAMAACNVVMQAYIEQLLELEVRRLDAAGVPDARRVLQADARLLETCKPGRRTLLPF